MRMHEHSRASSARRWRVALGATLVIASGSACARTPAATAATGAVAPEGAVSSLAVAFELPEVPPGNLTITPDGRRILSLHQYFNPPRVLAEVVGDPAAPTRIPREGEGKLPTGLASVLGIRSDTAGVLYILDNGVSGKAPPKLVLWDTRAERLVREIPLRSVTDTNSFVNDLVFDYARNHVYLSDPAGGPNAALVAVDLASGRARRLLVGHESVVPDGTPVVAEGRTPTQRLRDGSTRVPMIGVDGIGIDYAREWVYYGALNGKTMWRVRAADLANAALAPADLAARVERFATKPPSDGIALDSAGNIYLGDLNANAIGVIGQDRQYRQLVARQDLSWVDDFEFGPDGWLYVVATQLHRSPELNKGVRDPRPTWLVFRMRPLAGGRQGF